MRLLRHGILQLARRMTGLPNIAADLKVAIILLESRVVQF